MYEVIAIGGRNGRILYINLNGNIKGLLCSESADDVHRSFIDLPRAKDIFEALAIFENKSKPQIVKKTWKLFKRFNN